MKVPTLRGAGAVLAGSLLLFNGVTALADDDDGNNDGSAAARCN